MRWRNSIREIGYGRSAVAGSYPNAPRNGPIVHMGHNRSNDPAHKLQAALNHDTADLDLDYPRSYLVACQRWFTALSSSDRRIASVALSAFSKGDETAAKNIVHVLPPAPVCPLL
jgi:hypothetical protein